MGDSVEQRGKVASSGAAASRDFAGRVLHHEQELGKAFAQATHQIEATLGS
ncbi:MAG TPA: hypothetical protein VHN14_21760 [Kofleriaceae bacterium]|jgi:hypothetical protein|nr:hypothetical protein [Kofleriaceae bacterium]